MPLEGFYVDEKFLNNCATAVPKYFCTKEYYHHYFDFAYLVEYYKLFQAVKDIPILILRNIMSINLIQ